MARKKYVRLEVLIVRLQNCANLVEQNKILQLQDCGRIKSCSCRTTIIEHNYTSYKKYIEDLTASSTPYFQTMSMLFSPNQRYCLSMLSFMAYHSFFNKHLITKYQKSCTLNFCHCDKHLKYKTLAHTMIMSGGEKKVPTLDPNATIPYQT